MQSLACWRDPTVAKELYEVRTSRSPTVGTQTGCQKRTVLSLGTVLRTSPMMTFYVRTYVQSQENKPFRSTRQASSERSFSHAISSFLPSNSSRVLRGPFPFRGSRCPSVWWASWLAFPPPWPTTPVRRSLLWMTLFTAEATSYHCLIQTCSHGGGGKWDWVPSLHPLSVLPTFSQKHMPHLQENMQIYILHTVGYGFCLPWHKVLHVQQQIPEELYQTVQ